MLEIATIEQYRLLRGTIGPVRVRIVERRRGLASGEPSDGRRRRREAAEVGGDSDERAEAEDRGRSRERG